MSTKSGLVNLDAMIKREDLAATDSDSVSYENVTTISLRDFTKEGLIGPSLRKPDFQRETNHWTPPQIVSLLDCFINGDLIPSVILWKSTSHLFVIDGGHRLSVLRAWIEDDYGDGPISQSFFGYQISDDQRKYAKKTRELVNKEIGSWQHFRAKLEDATLDNLERKKLIAIQSRGIPIQWVNGNVDKAESSFFKINTNGTPLDSIEELLLKTRFKPISIASRAIIRAGQGHKYWSSFNTEISSEIENISKEIHTLLFDPEIRSPIKTLDLPLGGAKGVRTALQVLIDLILIANRNQQGEPKKIENTPDDTDGTNTIYTLKRTLNLAKRVTGNENGSLGLHPAIYFYGPTGRHSGPMFMGTMLLISQKLLNNDNNFFKKFTNVRKNLELILIEKKELIATILQKHLSPKRVEKYCDFLDDLISNLSKNDQLPSESDLVKMAGLDGKIVVGSSSDYNQKFSDDAKSKAFISAAIASAITCPICEGYLDTEKSISYDHIKRVREDGNGSADNCSLTHPYCNHSIKN